MPKTTSTLCSACGQTVRLPEAASKTSRIECPSCGAVMGTRKDILARTAANGLMMFGDFSRNPGPMERAPQASRDAGSPNQPLTSPDVFATIFSQKTEVSVPETLKLLFQAYERAYSLACQEHPPADEPADLELRKNLADLVLEAYAEGEDDPAMLKEIVLIRLRSQTARI